jgi:P4 family phage/plasmid primase-like protien
MSNYSDTGTAINPNFAEALEYLPTRGILEKTWQRAKVKIEQRDASQPDMFCGPTEAFIVFPYFDTERNALKEECSTRFFPPGDGPKFKWPKGIPLRPYVLPTSLAHANNPKVPLFIGEGPVRALLLEQHGYCAIASSGCWGPFAKRQNGELVKLPEDLSSWRFRDRTVYFMPDSDFSVNDDVLGGLLRGIIAFLSYSAVVKVLCWKAIIPKEGVDDYVCRIAGCDLAKQSAVLQDLIATAQDAVDFVQLRGGTEKVKGPHPWLDFFTAQLYAVEMSDDKRKQIGKHFAKALGTSSIGTKQKQQEWAPSGIESEAILAVIEREGQPGYRNMEGWLSKLNQPFWARLHSVEHTVIFERDEKVFYEYLLLSGLYVSISRAKIRTQISDRLLLASTEWGASWAGLSRFRGSDGIGGIIDHLQGQVEEEEFFSAEGKKLVHLANCVLVFDQTGNFTKEEFSPKHHSRNQSPIEYDPKAKCEQFKKRLLGHLRKDDRLMLQKYAGQCLLGRNLIQRFVIADGTGGASKTALLLVIGGIVGVKNVYELRTEHLADRFEIGRMIGKTLLTGADVKSRFLSSKGASKLKSLVGGDFLEAELKNSNHGFTINGYFNVWISCNARLRIALEGDASAWLRRLLIARYEEAYQGQKIPDIHLKLLGEEAPGILNWMLEGLSLLLADIKATGDIRQSPEQQARVVALLQESDSLRLFLKENIVRDDNADLTTDEIVSAYSEFADSTTGAWIPHAPSRIILLT